MVFFICNHCGESLKKQVVDKHVWKCKRQINVSCMDCLKDFLGNSYDAHTSCITEAEKYSGKDYVPKPSANKGAKKQESWITTVRSIIETKQNLPKGMMAVFEVIQKNDNIPKKQKGFMNFFQNSAKHIRRHDVEAAWAMIEEEVNRHKLEQQNVASNGQQKQADSSSLKQNGNEVQNGAATKRKADEEEHLEKPKKQKRKHTNTNGSNGDETKALLNEEAKGTNGTHEQDQEDNGQSNGGQKFRWNEVIRDLLISKNNQMKLTKLKKKVLKKYRQYTGGDCDEQQIDGKFEKKFNKKLQKVNLVVENDTVRLLE
uniref:Uncharacterized protein n=1 Tax=Anopheles atroparvus TaxID=41427 RepID=A0A182J3S8_ANOAO